MTPLLSLTDVTKRYGSRTVVDNFTATVMRGDKIGFVGPNGAGKTTLLKLILGELPADEGTVRVGTNLQVAYFDQMRAQLGNDIAFKAFKDGTLPFPDGAVIVALHWTRVSSE